MLRRPGRGVSNASVRRQGRARSFKKFESYPRPAAKNPRPSAKKRRKFQKKHTHVITIFPSVVCGFLYISRADFVTRPDKPCLPALESTKRTWVHRPSISDASSLSTALVYGAISRLITLYESAGLFFPFSFLPDRFTLRALREPACLQCEPACLQCEPACTCDLLWGDFSSTQKQQALHESGKEENNKHTQSPVVVFSIHWFLTAGIGLLGPRSQQIPMEWRSLCFKAVLCRKQKLQLSSLSCS